MAFSFSFIHFTSRQSHLRVWITENLRLACLHCSVTAVVGWHLARLVNAKVRVRTPVKPEVSFHTYVTRINESQMVGTVCNECLGDILA